MSPNQGRFELVERLARKFQVDGVIDLTWQGCHTYNIESYSLKKYLQDRSGIPFLQIETDYSESDTGQLKVRIEAFLEILHRLLSSSESPQAATNNAICDCCKSSLPVSSTK
jgi:benzoyl-CoA reductase/2-hydroxyglutaryl-CoA dehydratase subunit BcrC/BadD/HgdB